MTSSRPYSLRRRLVWLLTSAVALIWLVSALVVYQRAHHESDELLDGQLVQVADTLLAIVAGGEVDHIVEQLQAHAASNPVPIAFEIWTTRNGLTRRLVTSPGHLGFATGIPRGFSERPHAGRSWRFFVVGDGAAHYRVVVGQAHAARERLAREIGLSLLLPALLALPVMAFAVWWVVGRTLRPVDALAHTVAELDARALSPVSEQTTLPLEIAPLRDALNALIARVNAAFENERRFTADAAHELRTPLAALKIQAQVAQRATTPPTQTNALAQVIVGVDRMAHLVDQLLTLARVDPAAGTAPPAIDAAPLVAHACEEWRAQVARAGQKLSVDASAYCSVAIPAAWLDIALRNLLDNAVRYAGTGARIAVRLHPAAHGCVLEVADDGPGVPAAERSQLRARFVRGESENAGEGCGLGLSIVARIAELSQAQLSLGEGLERPDGGHGFSASLHFAYPSTPDASGA